VAPLVVVARLDRPHAILVRVRGADLPVMAGAGVEVVVHEIDAGRLERARL
jgi:hypothetical protein